VPVGGENEPNGYGPVRTTAEETRYVKFSCSDVQSRNEKDGLGNFVEKDSRTGKGKLLHRWVGGFLDEKT